MEIGSEFWKENKKYIGENEELFLSGRTALDVIIKDILCSHKIVSALLPSYCCQSMIDPFHQNQISVRFYDVFVDEKANWIEKIPKAKKHEIFFDMKYFGSNIINRRNRQGQPIDDNKIRESWEVIIEDATQNCYHEQHRFTADYEFASFRKWLAVDGISSAKKRDGPFLTKPREWETNQDYSRIKNRAFAMKADFLNGGATKKSDFLQMFKRAESELSENNVELRPNLNTVVQYYVEIRDLNRMRRLRLRNAKILAEGLKNISGINVALNVDEQGICPLFLPILIADTHIRDQLRQYLIDHEIYCPVHWPLSSGHAGISSCAKEIYYHELSVVCDQRYGINDMKRILAVIQSFFIIKKDVCMLTEI